MSTEEILLKSHGPLMTIEQLAKVLSRTANGVRVSLNRKSDWSTRINAARVKIGRRNYFRTADIAKVFDGGSGLSND